MMPVAYILRGLPASGKSTLRNRMIDEGKASLYLNKDELRYHMPELNERQIHTLFCEKLRLACTTGENIILDNTHLHTYTDFTKILNEHGYIIEEIFLDTPIQTCINRDIVRGLAGKRHTGKSVIIKMAMDAGLLGDIEQLPNYKSRKAVIFDLDGTLFNIEHRRQYVLEKPKNWDMFFAGIKDDTVYDAVADLYHTTPHTKIMVSGRGDEHRKITEQKLEQHGFTDHFALFMRSRGNREDDDIIKERIYLNYIKPYFDVQWVVDDRPRIIRMWKRQGLFTLQVGDGVEF